MDDPKDQTFKKELDITAQPYLEELFELLIEKKFIFRAKEKEKFTLKSDADSDKNSKTNSQEFLIQIQDFQTIAQVVHNKIAKDNHSLGNVANYIDYFNNQRITKIPLSNSKVRTLLENLYNMDLDEISESWYEEFKAEKINFREELLRILIYFSKVQLNEEASRLDYVLNPELREYRRTEGIVAAKRDHSKLILFDIKYRQDTGSISNLVLRAIEKWNAYPFPYEYTSKYLIIVVYVNKQEYETNRMIGQFTKMLVELDETLLNRIFFVPVALVKVDDFAVKTAELLKTFEGQTVTFDYIDSPLNHGWIGHTSINKKESIFIHQNDAEQGKVLYLNLPSSQGNDYMDYQLISSHRWRFEKVIFIIQPSQDCKFYVELAIKSDKRSFWFQIVDGEDEHKENSTNHTEFMIFVPFRNLGSWKIVSVGVRKYFNETFGKSGLILDKIEGVRVRGKIGIARILFE